VIYYWAVHGTLPHQRISAAVADVETEASVELEKITRLKRLPGPRLPMG